MTLAWTEIWWWWLLFVGVSFAVLEIGCIVIAHFRGQKNILTWTLSDTIRRWSALHRWIAPVVVGTCAMLLVHWFAQVNLP